MKRLQITAFLLLTFFVLSASCDERKENAQEPPADLLPPVETQKPNTSYSPAFEGQTRIAGVYDIPTQIPVIYILESLGRKLAKRIA